jgi:hypothetical protein
MVRLVVQDLMVRSIVHCGDVPMNFPWPSQILCVRNRLTVFHGEVGCAVVADYGVSPLWGHYDVGIKVRSVVHFALTARIRYV